MHMMIHAPSKSNLFKRLFEMGYANKQLCTLLQGFTTRIAPSIHLAWSADLGRRCYVLQHLYEGCCQ